MAEQRNYGIDFLRLVLMYMVCMLHTLGQGGVLNACARDTSEYSVYWLLEIISYCAVDGFAIISGYMANDKPRKYEKIVEMWFQVFFYSFIMTVILLIAGVGTNMRIEWILQSPFPVTFGKYWYFSAFFVLYLAMPILNKFLFAIDEITAKKMLVIIIVMFSFMETLGKPFKLGSGYSAFWIIILYCIGVLAKRIKLFESRKSILLIILWALCIFMTWETQVLIGKKELTNYVSPTILFSGLIMVVLFSRIHIKGTIISKLSPLAFGIYLFQVTPIVWDYILKDKFVSLAEKPLYMGVGLAFAYALAIFVIGLAVEFIRSKLAKVLKIRELSKKVVELLNKALEKMFAA